MHYVYLHGFCSGSRSFKGSYFKERFAEKGLDLLTPDLNGDDFTYLTISSQLAIISGICESLDGQITLIGSSMGAYLAALYAEENLAIRQLVLIAPAFQFASRRLTQLPPEQLAAWRESGYLSLFHFGYQEQRQLHFGIIDDAKEYDRRPLSRQLPAQLFHGLNDDAVPYQLSIEYLQQHPQARLTLLNSDHQLTEPITTIWQQSCLFLQLDR